MCLPFLHRQCCQHIFEPVQYFPLVARAIPQAQFRAQARHKLQAIEIKEQILYAKRVRFWAISKNRPEYC